jgi:glycine cleavage system H lipoate-binding protein
MMRVAVIDGLKYTSSHEWVKNDGAVATIGISDHAQVKQQHFLLHAFHDVPILCQ